MGCSAGVSPEAVCIHDKLVTKAQLFLECVWATAAVKELKVLLFAANLENTLAEVEENTEKAEKSAVP